MDELIVEKRLLDEVVLSVQPLVFFRLLGTVGEDICLVFGLYRGRHRKGNRKPWVKVGGLLRLKKEELEGMQRQGGAQRGLLAALY